MHTLKCAALWKWWMKVAKPTSLPLLASVFLKQQTSNETNSRAKQTDLRWFVCYDRKMTTIHAAEDLASTPLMSHHLCYCSFPGDHFQACQHKVALIILPWRKRLKVHSHSWIWWWHPSASSGAPHMAPACPPWSSQFLIKPLQRCEAPHPSLCFHKAAARRAFRSASCIACGWISMFSLDDLQ